MRPANYDEIKGEVLADARRAAYQVAVDGDGTATIDDVRALIDIPPEIDPRIMGGVFTLEDWEPVAFERSRRNSCHHRPIRRFFLRRWGLRQ